MTAKKKTYKSMMWAIERNMTLKEVAAELGCTSERVRQIEARALLKLKAALERRGITAKSLLPENFDEARA